MFGLFSAVLAWLRKYSYNDGLLFDGCFDLVFVFEAPRRAKTASFLHLFADFRVRHYANEWGLVLKSET